MIKIANTLALLWLFALAIDPAFADFNDYQHFRRGLYEVELGSTYFDSTANYASSGNVYHSLIAGQSFQDWNFYLSSRYDLDRHDALYAKINVGDSISDGTDARRSNSGFNEATVGYAHLFYSDAFEIIGDFNVVMPMNHIDVDTDTIPNAEGVWQTTGLLRLQKNFSMLLGYGYIGADYRAQRSSLMPWGFGLELHGSQLAFGAKIFGYQSITNDPDSANVALHTALQNRVSAGSAMFYSINPSLVDSEVSLKFKINPTWTMAASAGATITGASMASGYHGAVALQYFWDSEPSYYLKGDDDGVSSGKIQQFREETDDGVDQRLFQKNLTQPPPSDPPPAAPPAAMTPAASDISVKRVAPRPAPVPQDPPPNGGEVQLTLKKAKKKKKKKKKISDDN